LGGESDEFRSEFLFLGRGDNAKGNFFRKVSKGRKRDARGKSQSQQKNKRPERLLKKENGPAGKRFQKERRKKGKKGVGGQKKGKGEGGGVL